MEHPTGSQFLHICAAESGKEGNDPSSKVGDCDLRKSNQLLH